MVEVLISVSILMILLLRHRDGVIIQWIMEQITVSHTKKIYFRMGMIIEQMVIKGGNLVWYGKFQK